MPVRRGGASTPDGPAHRTRNAGETSSTSSASGDGMKRTIRDWAIVGSVMLLLALCVAQARAQQQTRFYGPDGRSIGTAVPLGNGSVQYYDSRGNSLGTSTTTGNTTRFYDARGRSTGSATGPVGPGPLGGRR